jgi:rhamnogalacturonan acetylesterase
MRTGTLIYLAVVTCFSLLSETRLGRAADQPGNGRVPKLFLIGDSTVRNSTKGQLGWGDPIVGLFDTNRIQVENHALGGRSSRTYFTEGLWEKVQAQIRPGDFVMMQFGHNDGGGLSHPKGRASLKGTSDETKTVQKDAKAEVVHTYGWYLRQYIQGTREKGATPIVLSLIPRNIWKGDKVGRASNDYGKWARETAQSSGAFFVDLNEIVARRYEAEGQAKVRELYFEATDHTHTTAAGAQVNAECVVEGVRRLKDCSLAGYLLPPAKGQHRN